LKPSRSRRYLLIESVFPGQRCLIETVEEADEAADVVWMLLALETFSLRNVDVLFQGVPEERCCVDIH